MTRIYFVLFITVIYLIVGCAPKAIDTPIESVGTLTPSYHSIAVQPIHKATDLTPRDFVGTDSDETQTSNSVEIMKPEIVQKNAHGF